MHHHMYTARLKSPNNRAKTSHILEHGLGPLADSDGRYVLLSYILQKAPHSHIFTACRRQR